MLKCRSVVRTIVALDLLFRPTPIDPILHINAAESHRYAQPACDIHKSHTDSTLQPNTNGVGQRNCEGCSKGREDVLNNVLARDRFLSAEWEDLCSQSAHSFVICIADQDSPAQ